MSTAASPAWASRFPAKWTSTARFPSSSHLRQLDAVTLLDINNTVPADLYNSDIKGKTTYTQKDTFMGFHCGNTCSKKLAFCSMKYQKIMARSLPIEVTQGTLEGDIAPGDITFFPSPEHGRHPAARIRCRG